jgi:hypothetical protein
MDNTFFPYYKGHKDQSVKTVYSGSYKEHVSMWCVQNTNLWIWTPWRLERQRERGKKGHIVGDARGNILLGEGGRNRIALLTISHASSACPSDKTTAKLKTIGWLRSMTWNKYQKNIDLVINAEAHNLDKMNQY